MLRTAHFTTLRHSAAWLLVLGLLAMSLHVLAGTGSLRGIAATGNGGRFAAELCTSHGLLTVDPAQTRGDSSQPATGVHDCCKLCAAGAPLLVADMAARVPLVPTFAAPHDSPTSARPRPAVRTAHPPRGPPARA